MSEYYYLKAWQDDESIIPTKPFDDDECDSYFYIKISAELDAEHVARFWVPFDGLIDHDFSTSRPIVSAMLSEVCVPIDDHPDMVDHIIGCAHSMASGSRNVGSVILPMFVHIISGDYVLDDDVGVDDNLVVSESSMEGTVGLKEVPASKESVETLEMVKVGTGLEFMEQCAFCQEKIMVGFEAKRMSCDCEHVSHTDCIVRWLSGSHLCPLCHFGLPTSSVDMSRI